MLIPKPPKNGEQSTDLCSLTDLILEHLNEDRLREEVENKGGRSLEQYGFSKDRSSIVVIKKVVDLENTGNKTKFDETVTFDDKTPEWSKYVLNIIKNNLSERKFNSRPSAWV